MWEQVHRNFMCAYIGKKVFNQNGLCKLCGRLEESRVHIILNCEVTKTTISNFNNILRLFHSENLTTKEWIFGLISDENLEKRLFNYVLYSIRHIIYRNINHDYTNIRTAIIYLTRKNNF